MNAWRRRIFAEVCGVVFLFMAPWAWAMQVEIAPEPTSESVPMPAPKLAASISRLLAGSVLDEEQKRQFRLAHGLWTDADLQSPADRARAALVTGNLDDSSLRDPQADLLDRAQAMVLRGELDDALTLLGSQGSMRAIGLRAQALETLGRFGRADAALEPLVERMGARSIASADELADGVEALMVRSRLRGPGRAGKADVDAALLMQMLSRGRTDLDRLAWQPRLVEAAFLMQRDNRAQSVQALKEVLSLNPRVSGAWAMLGEFAVDSFDFPQAESIALRLEVLAPGSIDAVLIRARAALRKRDPERANRLLDEAIKRFPYERRLRELRAGAAAGAFDIVDAQTRLDALDALNDAQAASFSGAKQDVLVPKDHAKNTHKTGSPDGYLAVGKVLAEARQYDLAADMLMTAANRQPQLPTPWIELGLLQMQAGRDMRAKDALEHALALDPFNVRALNSLSLVKMLNSFGHLESAHFLVRYKPGVDEILAKEMVPVLEDIYARVCSPSMFDHEPSQKTTIELMPDHASFAVRISGMPAIHTMAAATGPVIAMETPREGPGHKVGPYDWPRTIQHEFIHTVTLARTHNRIPHWFTEAAAVWGEGGPVPSSWWPLLAQAYATDSLFDMDTISLRFVRPLKPTDRTQAYAQGQWMYQYMVERWGNHAPLTLMDLYAKGESQNDGMLEALGMSPEAFFEDFKAWAGEQLIEMGLRLPAGMPDIVEILGDPAKATEAQLTEALKAHPNQPELLELAVAQTLKAADGHVDVSLVLLLKRLAIVRPREPEPHRLLVRYAIDRESQGQTLDPEVQAALIANLEFLDAREEHSPAYAIELAQRYAAQGNLDKAWSRVVRATHIAPVEPRVREEAARIALLRGELSMAEHQIEVLTKLEPDRTLHQRRLKAIRAKRDAQH